MARYHINPETGEPGACRAKKRCPFGDDLDHFNDKKAALEYVEKSLALENELKTLKANPSPMKPTTLAALNSTMSYEGPEPEWLGETSHKRVLAANYPVKPKIIDVIEVNGKPTAVVWEEFSYANNDVEVQKERGYNCHRVTLNDMESGVELGYLKIGYVDEDSLERSFGKDGYEALRWKQDYTGSQMGTYSYDDDYNKVDAIRDKSGEELLEAKRKLWAKSHAGMGVCPEGFDRTQLTWSSLVNLNSEHAPDSEEIIDRDLARLNEKAAEDQKEYMISHSIPSIDYASTEDSVRGQGLGQALYVYGARMVGRKGKVLRASGLQTEKAEAAWRRLASHEEIPVKIVDLHYKNGYVSGKKCHYAIDFTD